MCLMLLNNLVDPTERNLFVELNKKMCHTNKIFCSTN